MSDRGFPTGTVTFLASDMVGSTRLVQEAGPAVFREILEQHNAILRRAFASHGGTERGTQGDSFLVMFREAPAGLAAAAEAQAALASASWPRGASVRVRMGVHSGVGMLGGDDYVGIDVHRTARISSAAHGGQVLVSEATRALAHASLPAGTRLRDLGEHKLRDLARRERLYQLVIDGQPAEFPPIETEDAPAGNLPGRLTAFVGREPELEELERLIEGSRLITLTGPGGTGKTSLAGEFASRSAAAFPDGTWFVGLEATADPSFVVPAIANTFGLLASPGSSTAERLADHLRDRSILLILDNFEQVLPAAVAVDELLRAAPGLKVVVTSRAPLRLSAEQEFPVAPLGLPEPIPPVSDAMRSPAVQLFVERARRARPGYVLTDDDAAAVAEICRRLDGLPLGIELAASRMALLPPRTIAERLAERLDLPGEPSRDLPARQRSMERAIAWSYDLLEPPDQRLLARLSVFRGGWRLEEAEAICGPPSELGTEVLEGLSVLVGHSLVQAMPGTEGARFRLLETIQAYAADRLRELGETTTIGWRHALAYRDLAESAAPHLPGGDQMRWLQRLSLDHDNLRTAIGWAIDEDDAELALRLGAASWRFWQLRGHLEEGLAWMTRILAMPGAEAPSRWRVRGLEAAAGLSYWTADLERADTLYQTQLELARTLGDGRATADALFNLGHTRFLLDRDHAIADRLAEEAEELYRHAGDQRSIARVTWTRVNRMLERGDPGVAELLHQTLRRFEELGDDWYAALAMGTLAYAALARGELAAALRWALASMSRHHAMGDIASTTIALRGVAVMFVDSGMPEEAATIQSAFEGLCERYGVRPPAFFEQLGPDMRGRRDMDLDRYPDEAARGGSMSLEEAVDHVAGVVREHLARSA